MKFESDITVLFCSVTSEEGMKNENDWEESLRENSNEKVSCSMKGKKKKLLRNEVSCGGHHSPGSNRIKHGRGEGVDLASVQF